MEFSRNIQFLRAQEDLTQEQLAEQLGVSRQTVSKWESGQSFPEMETLLVLCDRYAVTMDLLLRGSVEDSRVTDTQGYDRFMRRFARRIALAVGGILAGAGVTALLSALGVGEMPAGALFLLVITVAVVTLVASGIQHEQYCKKHPVISDFYTEEEKDAFHQKFVWLISGSVGAILFAVAMLVAFFSVFPEREPYESLAGAGFLLILAGAVATMIYAGIREDAYDIEDYNRENNPTPEEKAREELTGTVCAVIMLLATAVYVGLGFTQNAWGSAWWVFPVGGILCAVAAVILDHGKKDR